MLHPYGIQIGAGVAQTEDTVYYVLNVIVDYASSPTGLVTSKTETPEVVPVNVATPQTDGSIVHTVEKGQALWSIAITYGVTVDQLRILNNLSETANIYEGQQLYVRAAYTQTPTMTSTVTPMPPTRTPIPPQTPQALKTQADASDSNSIVTQGNRQVLGIVLIIGCGIGLAYLIYSMFRKRE
ncbi:MAG: LysM peptidoglycan-binding domain-containing protein [Chloroflexi bacterium]|nr:LysM peptidoglycan-binding domain-containing protein [Chloroflexota bacterium]